MSVVSADHWAAATLDVWPQLTVLVRKRLLRVLVSVVAWSLGRLPKGRKLLLLASAVLIRDQSLGCMHVAQICATYLGSL